MGRCDVALPLGTMMFLMEQGRLPPNTSQEPKSPAPRDPLHCEAWHWPVPDLSSFLVPESQWPQHHLERIQAAHNQLVYQQLPWWKGLTSRGQGGCPLRLFAITSLLVLCRVEWRGQVTTTGSTRTAALRVPTAKGWALSPRSLTRLLGSWLHGCLWGHRN